MPSRLRIAGSAAGHGEVKTCADSCGTSRKHFPESECETALSNCSSQWRNTNCLQVNGITKEEFRHMENAAVTREGGLGWQKRAGDDQGHQASSY
ncbi:hypothetical protein DV515_00011554 [Chloebia gouldiae]|uniref:Uncharacterized protein n=1 Tax=Chloebia gouldiae TaxID=44316 RepID=A0A3L8S6R4_CHLGU|nr:hypothetical protein DV515_00011554 [Chloebia gouldiae]